MYDVSCSLQAERKNETKQLAALKKVEIREEDELDEFMVEIEILTECNSKHIVGIHEAYFHGNDLWVSLLRLQTLVVHTVERVGLPMC